jgi:DNA integrity scanning protein DisA with diadenylate cyclase activity
MAFVDFSEQLGLEHDGQAVEDFILKLLQSLSSKVASKELNPIGSLIVLGKYEKGEADGMIQMKPKQNPIKSLMMVNSKDGIRFIKEFSQKPYDGAIVINHDGQILGAGIYLVISDPTLDIPDGCGTRHKSAASFSLQNSAISVLTLSEETNTIRIWKRGKAIKTINS